MESSDSRVALRITKGKNGRNIEMSTEKGRAKAHVDPDPSKYFSNNSTTQDKFDNSEEQQLLNNKRLQKAVKNQQRDTLR